MPPASVHNVLYLLPSPSKITSIPRTFLFFLPGKARLVARAAAAAFDSSVRTKPGLEPGPGRGRRARNGIVLVGRSCSVHKPEIIDFEASRASCLFTCHFFLSPAST